LRPSVDDDTEWRNFYLELDCTINILRDMKSSLSIACALAAGFSTAAFAGTGSAAVNRHRLADCMSRQMAASRTLSYYAAQSLCQDQLKAQERQRAPDGLKAQNDNKLVNNALTNVVAR